MADAGPTGDPVAGLGISRVHRACGRGVHLDAGEDARPLALHRGDHCGLQCSAAPSPGAGAL